MLLKVLLLQWVTSIIMEIELKGKSHKPRKPLHRDSQKNLLLNKHIHQRNTPADTKIECYLVLLYARQILIIIYSFKIKQ